MLERKCDLRGDKKSYQIGIAYVYEKRPFYNFVGFSLLGLLAESFRHLFTMMNTRRYQQQQAHGSKDVSFRSITGTSFRTTSTGVSFRTTGTGTSFRTAGTYRSVRSFGTAKTAMTDGTDGSILSTPNQKSTFKPPKMLAPITNEIDESPVSGKGTTSLALDDGFNRIFALLEETTEKVSSSKCSKNTSRNNTWTQENQRKNQGGVFGRFFRRRDNSVCQETFNSTLSMEQSQSASSVQVREPSTVSMGAQKYYMTRESMTDGGNTDKPKETVHDHSSFLREESSLPSHQCRTSHESTTVTERRNSWVGLTLEIPNIDAKHSTEPDLSKGISDATSCNRKQLKNEEAKPRAPPRRALTRQPSCRSLFESFRRVQRSVPDQVCIQEEDSVSSSSSSDLRSLDGKASCTKPTALQDAISSSSSTLYMLTEAGMKSEANNEVNFYGASSKVLLHPPPVLQVTTSISSVSSSHLIEFTTICRDPPRIIGYEPPKSLEVRSTIHAAEVPPTGKAEKIFDGKVKVNVEDLPMPPFLYSVSSSSVQNFMQKIQERGQRSIQQESNATPPPELKWSSSSSSQQRYDWGSNEDERRINPTLSPKLRVQISTTLLNSGRGIDVPPTLPVRRESSEYTLEWTSYHRYFENSHYATHHDGRGCDTPPFFPEEASPSMVFGGKKSPNNEINLVDLMSPVQNLETACNKSIEIEPGHKVTVRGAEETMLYVAADATGLASNTRSLIATCQCWACSATMHCVFDAAYVVCPVCRTVQPTDHHQGWGAGLGFLTRDWDEWKSALSCPHS
jgi:hypothetical protein